MVMTVTRPVISNASSNSAISPSSVNGLPILPADAGESAKKANAVVHKEGSFMAQQSGSARDVKRKPDSEEDDQVVAKKRKLENGGREDKPVSVHRKESERSSDSHRSYSSNSSHSHSHSRQDVDMDKRRESRGSRDDEYDSHREKPRHSSDSRGSSDRYESKSEKTEARSNSHASQVKVHYLPMKGTIYLDYIKSGVKKFEGRVHGPMCSSMRAGDHLKLYDNKARRGIICEILSKDVYKSFEVMLRAKGVFAMLPQLKREGVQQNEEDLIRQGIKVYQGFPGSERVNTSGVAAIGVKYLKDVQ